MRRFSPPGGGSTGEAGEGGTGTGHRAPRICFTGVMAKGRNPSGVPSKRLPSFMRPEETNIEGRLAGEPEGFRRVRRGLLIATAIVAALTVVFAISGGRDAALGWAGLVLAPLLVVLIGAQVAVMISDRRQ